MDLGESHGLKGERKGASRRQQSMKGGGTKKLTANYLPMRRDHKDTTESGHFIAMINQNPLTPSPPPVISNDQSLNQSKYLRLLDTSDLFLLLN